MTSAPLKDLSSIVTYIGPKSAPSSARSESDISFGEMMTKAQDGKAKEDIGKDNSQLKKTEAPEEDKTMQPSKKPEVKESTKEQKTPSEDMSPEDVEKFNEAAQNVVTVIAQVLEVTPQEVIDAAGSLELTPIDLLDTSNIGDVVLTLSRESDPISLITNEELFTEVKDLTSAVDAIVEDLAEDMDIEVSDVSNMIEKVKVDLKDPSEMQMSVEAGSDKVKAPLPEEKLTVNIKSGDDSLKVVTDDKGNIEGTITVNKTETPENKKEFSEGDKNEGKDQKEDHPEVRHEFQHGNSINNNLNNEITTNAPADVPTESYISEDGRRILDQVTEGLRGNIRLGTDEIELSLHPASLGNVKVNLINKGGEITAQFKVQNETVREVIEGQINLLKESFKDSGVKIQAVEVSVETQSFEQNLWQGADQSTDNNGERENQRRRPRRINLEELSPEFMEEATDEEILAAEMMEANGNTVDYTA